jgi:membrane protein
VTSDDSPRAVGWKVAVRRALHGFVEHRGIDSAAALTFFALLALLPGALAVVSVFAIFDDRDRAVQDLVAVLDTVLPDQAARDLEDVLRELLALNNPCLALGIALVLLVWTTSGFATAFGRAVNAVYEVEEGRPFWVFRGRMLLVAVVLDLLGAVVVTVLLGPGDLPIWSVVRWPVLLGFAVLYVAVLYAFTPNVVRPRLRWVSVGSSVAILIWIIATAGFALYVALVDHGAIYGSLGGAIVGLLWLYLTNAALVAGVELDAEFTRVKQLERGEDAARRLDLPMRDDRRIRTLRRQRRADIAAARELQEGADPGPEL